MAHIRRVVTSTEVIAVASPPRTTVLVRELSRSWLCAGCDRSIQKGETVHIHVTVGLPHNAVFHVRCAPATDGHGD